MAELLPSIHSPADFRRFDLPQLKQLAAEVRERIIGVVMRKGGHLGASLGALELTIALHHVYNTPKDKIVFDVGHQAYGHKILTGRNDRFETIREEGGLSGFLKMNESEYDAFGAGHASTAISAALGYAIARDLRRDDYKVVAMIGDGAMTGGLAFEGLNNAGLRRETDFCVILNDNSMSISPNTGGLARTLSQLVTHPFYNDRKGDLRELVRSLPAGGNLIKMIRKFESGVKGMITPGKFFEDLGFRYIGPVDGHDLDLLVPMLQRVRELEGPILLHCKTIKGKGLPEAEADQVWGHAPTIKKVAVPGIEVKKPTAPSYSKLFSDALEEIAEQDDRVVAITAAMLEGTGLTGFQKRFPERTLDVGIAEGHAVVSAAGMACGGMRPVCAIYSTFLQRAFDMIVHDVALQHLPVTFVLDRGGLVGADGPTHHGTLDLAYLRPIPGIWVMAPKDEAELRSMLYTGVMRDDGPSAIRFPRGNGRGAENGGPLKAMEPGRAEVLREGADSTIWALGPMVWTALEAADLLAERGLDVGVVNARWVKPLDTTLLATLAARHRFLFTLEDHQIQGGFGGAVCEALAEGEHFSTVNIPIGLPDRFIDHGTRESLLAQCGLDAEGVAAKVAGVLRRQARHKPDVSHVANGDPLRGGAARRPRAAR